MCIEEYLYNSGCEISVFQDHCNFEIIDIKITEVIILRRSKHAHHL